MEQVNQLLKKFYQIFYHLLIFFFESKNIKDLSSYDRAKYINYIPSRFEIFDEYLNVLEYLKLSIIEKKNIEDIEKIISLLKLEDLKLNSCVDLSSGEQQLLLLASALLHNAKITILMN